MFKKNSLNVFHLEIAEFLQDTLCTGKGFFGNAGKYKKELNGAL